MDRFFELLLRELGHIITERISKMEARIVTALTDLQTADENLGGIVTKLLTDYATAVANAGTDPAALEAVVSDMNQMAANITAADPNAAPVSGDAPVTGT